MDSPGRLRAMARALGVEAEFAQWRKEMVSEKHDKSGFRNSKIANVDLVEAT